MERRRVAKWCGVVGKVLILSAMLFLIWSFIDVQVEQSRKPAYYDPENDLPRIAACYFWVMGGVGVGCTLLWAASCFAPKNK